MFLLASDTSRFGNAMCLVGNVMRLFGMDMVLFCECYASVLK